MTKKFLVLKNGKVIFIHFHINYFNFFPLFFEVLQIPAGQKIMILGSSVLKKKDYIKNQNYNFSRNYD